MRIYVLVTALLAMAGLAACTSPQHHSGGKVQRYEGSSSAHDARPDVHRNNPGGFVHRGL